MLAKLQRVMQLVLMIIIGNGKEAGINMVPVTLIGILLRLLVRNN